MEKTELTLENSKMDYEAECERLSIIIMRQSEMIHALKMACQYMSDAMVQEDRGINP